uniref:cholesterol 7-alpha-monooxygenase-like n=1 Tax=Ciona intestinalis TaxID=7719 RepID=UPI000180C3F8|nr:cholesterol 7-alpha-monooxygenase-like [Ciona intestinalis]|eukprot:XP_009860779.2 cholesterol 7-alpha-monooxygenase-like [Ciona intestinalis]
MYWSIGLALFNLCLLSIVFFQRRRRQGEPPLVNHTLPFIGAALDFGKDPLNYLRNLQSKFGDVFTIKLAGWDTHVFMNPLDVRSLERAKFLGHQEIIGDFVTRMVGSPHSIHNHEHLAEIFPKNGKPKNPDQVLSPAADVQKKLTHSIEKNLRGSMQLNLLCSSCKPVVVNALHRTLGHTMNHHKPIKLHEFSKKLIFDITFNLLFGSLPDYERASEETERTYDVFKTYFKGSALLVDRIPIHLLPETKKARGIFLKMMEELDWSKRENVSKLIDDIVKVNPKLEFLKQRARHLMVVLWAAQANTTPALFWTLFYLIANPDAKRAVLEEYEQLRRQKMKHSSVRSEEKGWPTMKDILQIERKDLDKLVILDGCLRETMRLTGASMSIRKATRDESIKTSDGKQYSVRRGDYTAFFAPVTHMDEDIYENPQDFVHDRFLVSVDDTSSSCSSTDSDASSPYLNTDGRKFFGQLKPRSRFTKNGQRVAVSRAIMTFGYGVTRCPGRHIALIEIKLAVLAMLGHFNVQFVDSNTKPPSFDLTHLGFGVMPPDTDIEVLIAPKCC